VPACILICCESGKYKDALAALKKVRGVKRAFPTTGRWDLVAEVEAADTKALGETSMKIHALLGVRATETLVGF